MKSNFTKTHTVLSLIEEPGSWSYFWNGQKFQKTKRLNSQLRFLERRLKLPCSAVFWTVLWWKWKILNNCAKKVLLESRNFLQFNFNFGPKRGGLFNLRGLLNWRQYGTWTRQEFNCEGLPSLNLNTVLMNRINNRLFEYIKKQYLNIYKLNGGRFWICTNYIFLNFHFSIFALIWRTNSGTRCNTVHVSIYSRQVPHKKERWDQCSLMHSEQCQVRFIVLSHFLGFDMYVNIWMCSRRVYGRLIWLRRTWGRSKSCWPQTQNKFCLKLDNKLARTWTAAKLARQGKSNSKTVSSFGPILRNFRSFSTKKPASKNSDHLCKVVCLGNENSCKNMPVSKTAWTISMVTSGWARLWRSFSWKHLPDCRNIFNISWESFTAMHGKIETAPSWTLGRISVNNWTLPNSTAARAKWNVFMTLPWKVSLKVFHKWSESSFCLIRIAIKMKMWHFSSLTISNLFQRSWYFELLSRSAMPINLKRRSSSSSSWNRFRKSFHQLGFTSIARWKSDFRSKALVSRNCFKSAWSRMTCSISIFSISIATLAGLKPPQVVLSKSLFFFVLSLVVKTEVTLGLSPALMAFKNQFIPFIFWKERKEREFVTVKLEKGEIFGFRSIFLHTPIRMNDSRPNVAHRAGSHQRLWTASRRTSGWSKTPGVTHASTVLTCISDACVQNWPWAATHKQAHACDPNSPALNRCHDFKVKKSSCIFGNWFTVQGICHSKNTCVIIDLWILREHVNMSSMGSLRNCAWKAHLVESKSFLDDWQPKTKRQTFANCQSCEYFVSTFWWVQTAKIAKTSLQFPPCIFEFILWTPHVPPWNIWHVLPLKGKQNHGKNCTKLCGQDVLRT